MTIALWIGFLAFILVMLALDLGVLNRKEHIIKAREAIGWTTVCVILALLFNVFVYFLYQHQWFGVVAPKGGGAQAATEFFTAWLIEYSLSLDNIFVIAVIFEYMRVPPMLQHRVLFWGILGALVMRGAMIAAGAALMRFEIVIIVFGLLLLWSAAKMLRSGDDDDPHPDRNPLVKIARRFYPVTPDYVGHNFFVIFNGRRAMTPLFVALLVVEGTDVLFAVDSIPAVFAVTEQTFIVFSSNVFAILGLRSLYFALAALLRQFRYLKVSLAFILAYVGVKMLLDATHVYEIPVQVTLCVIVGILGVGVLASILVARREQPALRPVAVDPDAESLGGA